MTMQLPYILPQIYYQESRKLNTHSNDSPDSGAIQNKHEKTVASPFCATVFCLLHLSKLTNKNIQIHTSSHLTQLKCFGACPSLFMSAHDTAIYKWVHFSDFFGFGLRQSFSPLG